MPDPSLDRILGTGFLRQTLSNREGGADLEEFRVAQIGLGKGDRSINGGFSP